jgi:hypothetical protein
LSSQDLLAEVGASRTVKRIFVFFVVKSGFAGLLVSAEHPKTLLRTSRWILDAPIFKVHKY